MPTPNSTIVPPPTDPSVLARHIIDFDPRHPAGYRFAAAADSVTALDLAAATLHPDHIPWPDGLAPQPQPFPEGTTDSSPLPTADALIVTYTVAEGYALADVLTPGRSTAQWMPYRNGWDELKVSVAPGAPSLAQNQAGLWSLTEIGGVSVVVMKSDLHPVTDGAELPIRTLWRQIIAQVQPTLVITTGTAGGIGADTLLGDVIVSQHLQWDCTRRFADQPFAHEAYTAPGPSLTADVLQAKVADLLPINAAHLPAAARPPMVVTGAGHLEPVYTVTTDFFAFDDADDHYGLRAYQPQARAVEMDDAALPLACADMADPPMWVSVRNASDPQMNGSSLREEDKEAAAIYERYGYWTTIGSAITCWALLAGQH